jgi:putative CocE/NonD family hydrolase
MESRKDVLVFTSAPLTEDLEVTGQVLLNLYLSSKVSDIDLAVNLTDVYPDGKSVLIAEGLRRLDLKPSQKGKAQEVEIDLWSTSLVFAKGHSIRLTIAGSNYPRYELSPQKVTAESQDCQILVGPEHPSRLILPIARIGFE